MEVVLSCFEVALWFIYFCQLVDHIEVIKVFSLCIMIALAMLRSL